jgi:calcineurin-like phosphoesterase family protein
MRKDVWFTSDTHYGHKNICKGTTEWTDEEKYGPNHSPQSTRDFDTLEQMNQALVDRINENVKENDVLYHLGDWSFGGLQNILEFRLQLNCKNIHLIFGNHDHHIEKNSLFHESHSGPLKCRDLFSTVQHYKEISIDKQRIILSHYAMRVWNKSHHGSWMLYGHSHGTLPAYQSDIRDDRDYNFLDFKTMDVGVDTNNLKPYNFEELRVIMDQRPSLCVDHHNENTN